jgi:hypothetical protein
MTTAGAFRRAVIGALAGILLTAAASAPVSARALPLLAPVALAAGPATFGTPTAESSFTGGVNFTQPVTIDREVARAELLLAAGDSAAQTVIPVASPSGTGSVTLTHQLDPTVDGHILPNTVLTARWRLVGVDDPADVALGPEVRVTFEDDRFDWQTASGDLVRVHWHEGSEAFGARALQIGEDAVREASELLQVTETDPVDFFVYADRDQFYDALGPGTRENVGGQANAEIRTMFALISANEIDDAWVGVVIPHELTHLVFDTAVTNPYHFPPRWLNEGLAVYLSEGYGASDRAAVEGAASSGSLIPIDGLGGQFPTTFERFALAYAESVSAVDYLIRTHGQDAMVALIRSYAEGRTDDEAFSDALGVDMTAFGEAWLADLGAAPPTRYGPQPAPPGPIPDAWLAEPGASAPAPSGDAAATAGPSSSPSPETQGGEDATTLQVILIAVAAVVLIAFGIALSRRRTSAGSGP